MANRYPEREEDIEAYWFVRFQEVDAAYVMPRLAIVLLLRTFSFILKKPHPVFRGSIMKGGEGQNIKQPLSTTPNFPASGTSQGC